MHAELQAFFAEHKGPTHASLRSTADAALVVEDAVEAARHQMLRYEHLLRRAELAPHDARLDTKLEMMHQTIGNARGQFDAMTRALRELVRDFAQLDRYVAEWQADIAAYEAAATASPEGGRP